MTEEEYLERVITARETALTGTELLNQLIQIQKEFMSELKEELPDPEIRREIMQPLYDRELEYARRYMKQHDEETEKLEEIMREAGATEQQIREKQYQSIRLDSIQGCECEKLSKTIRAVESCIALALAKMISLADHVEADLDELNRIRNEYF